MDLPDSIVTVSLRPRLLIERKDAVVRCVRPRAARPPMLCSLPMRCSLPSLVAERDATERCRTVARFVAASVRYSGFQ